MVGGVLYNCEDINKQNKSSPGTPAEASGTEGRQREMQEDDLRENQKNREVDSRELKG